MKAYIITLSDSWEKKSQQAAKDCINSINKTKTLLEPELFSATTPATITEHMKEVFGKKVKWNWPMDSNQDGYDFNTTLYKKHYPGRDQQRIIACAMSHTRLWKKCVDLNEEMVILEHDTLFIRKFDPKDLDTLNWGVVGLNDPRGATRKSSIFYKKVSELGRGIHNIPSVDSVDELYKPQGLAGNSAYIIRPKAAKQLLSKIHEVDLWPNDALMCKELFSWLRVVYPFYTRVQGIESTTTR